MTPISKGTMVSQVVAGFLMADISVRFSSAHFTYALIAFVMFLIYFYWKKRTLVTPVSAIRPMCLGLLLFYGLLALTALISGDKANMRVALDYAEMCLPFFMLYFLRSHAPVDAGVRWGLALGGVIVCSYGLYQHEVLQLDRILSFSAHANSFGTLLFLLIPMAAYSLGRAGNILSRLVWAALLGVLGYCLFLTGSRGAIGGLLGGFVLAMLLLGWQMRKEIHPRTLLLGLAAIIAAISIGYGYVRLDEDASRSAGERAIMIEASVHMWEDHQLLGVGLANWQANYYSDTYHPAEGTEQGLSMAHNMPIHFLSTAGAMGLFGYLAFWALSLYSLCRAKKSGVNKGLLFAMYTIFFAFSLQGLVDSTIINKIPAKLYFALMGYFFACTLPQRAEEIPQGGSDESITGRPA